MKKLLYCAAALATMFFTACQQENLEPAGKGSTVSFSVEVPGLAVTKADVVDNGSNINDLVYAVYKVSDDATTLEEAVEAWGESSMLVYQVNQTTTSFTGGKTTVDLELLNDQNYVVLFWAQVNDAWVAGDDFDLTEITYPANMMSSNSDLAAFSGRAFIAADDVEKNVSREVTLTRPFAQINVGTTLPQAFTVQFVDSKVTVYDAGDSFNVASQAAKGSTDVVFGEAALPTNYLNVEGDATNYTYVAMNYVFANGVVDVEYDIETVDHGTVNRTIPAVPVEKNFRTNIIGNLLTSNAHYEIKLDAEWGTPANIVSVWDGKEVATPEIVTDEVTNEPYYAITNGAELAGLAALVNGTTGVSQQSVRSTVQNFKLTADIDLGNHQWTPIGHSDKVFFSGVFDGNGHTIKNLSIVETEAKEGKAHIGLFGFAKNATIKDVTFENVNLSIPCLDIDHSQGHIGAVAGSLEGTSTIEDVTVYGDIKVESTLEANGASRVAVVVGGNTYANVTMKNVHVVANEGSYLKANNNVGALAGQLQGVSVFEDCSSNIDVTGYKFFAGGIIGLAAGDQTFTNCHSTGDVKILAGRAGRANDHYRVGGIAGGWADGKTKVCTLTDCSYTGQISGTNSDGSVAENFDYAGYVGRGYTLTNCAGSKVVIDGVEYVQVYDNVYGVYSVDGVYEVNTAADLKALANDVNAGNSFEGETIKLFADIDLKNENWTPIGYWQTFNGNFDGQGYTISNLKHNGTEEDCYVGLFGYTENATIKNLTINNVDLKLVANASWAGGHMGALVGNAEGATVIENITVTGDVKIDGDLTKAGAGRIGGVVGGNACTGLIKNVVVNANAGSFVKGNNSVGGIAGQLQPTHIGGALSFENCSSNIDVTAAQFYAGGIIGLSSNAISFTDCSASGNISVVNGRAGNANDLYRVGGIAGGWDDGADKVLSLVNCSTACVLSGKSADGEEATTFDCGGFVGRGYSAVVGAKVIVNGAEYVYAGDGKYADAEGFVIVADGLKQKGVEYKVYSAAGLEYLNTMFANKTAGRDAVVQLVADIDFSGKTWTPVDSHADTAFEIAEINGNGYTISNLTINGQAMFTRFAGLGDVVVKDVTFVGAKVESGTLNTSILTGQTYQNVLLDNVDVKNSSIKGTYKVAPLIATVYNENPTTVTATLKNCDVENTDVTCTSFDFCTAGMVAFVYEGNNDKVEFENCTVKDVRLYAKQNGYSSHAAIYVNDADTDDCFNEATGVTVTNVTFTAL